jgi:hypothetical protein
MEGETPGDDPVKAASIVRQVEEAGATWFLEGMWSTPDMDKLLRRIEQGPSRLG